MTLESICGVCNGNKTVKAQDVLNGLRVDRICMNCRGTGVAPNEEGKAILAFMRKHQHWVPWGLDENGRWTTEDLP